MLKAIVSMFSASRKHVLCTHLNSHYCFPVSLSLLAFIDSYLVPDSKFLRQQSQLGKIKSSIVDGWEILLTVGVQELQGKASCFSGMLCWVMCLMSFFSYASTGMSEHKDDLKPVSLGNGKYLKFSFSTAKLYKLQKCSLLQNPDCVHCPFLVLLSEGLILHISFVAGPM